MLMLKQLIAQNNQKKKQLEMEQQQEAQSGGKTLDVVPQYSSIAQDCNNNVPQTTINHEVQKNNNGEQANNHKHLQAKAEITRKESLFASIGQTLENKQSSKGLSLATRIGLGALKKSIRAQKAHLGKEKHQLEAIQRDLGVDLMTGNNLREKLPHEFHTKNDLEKTIETLVKLPPEHRGTRQVGELIKIIK